MNRNRTELLVVVTSIAVASFAVAGCDSGNPTSTLATGGGGPLDIDPSGPGWHYEGVIAGNHGHKATVNGAQILRDEPLVWNIQSQADHPHWLELSVDQLRRLEDLERIDVRSTTAEGHDHWVRFN